VQGGSQCLTREQLAEQVATEKHQKIELQQWQKQTTDTGKWLQQQLAQESKEEEANRIASMRAMLRLQNLARGAEARWNPQRIANRERRSSLPCEPAIVILDHIAKGISDSSPSCPAGLVPQTPSAPAPQAQQSSSAQPQQRTISLNPDLKDIATLAPVAPPQRPKPQASSTKSFEPAQPDFVSIPGSNSAGIWNRLGTAVSAANQDVKNDPNFNEGKKDLEAAAAVSGVGCAVGAVLAGGAGGAATVGAGAIPAALAGCAAGATAANAAAGVVETGYSIAETADQVVKKDYAQAVGQTVTQVVADVADEATKKIPVTSTLQVAGSWGTYFLYNFYTGTPGD
jgi:hypothetical protein